MLGVTVLLHCPVGPVGGGRTADCGGGKSKGGGNPHARHYVHSLLVCPVRCAAACGNAAYGGCRGSRNTRHATACIVAFYQHLSLSFSASGTRCFLEDEHRLVSFACRGQGLPPHARKQKAALRLCFRFRMRHPHRSVVHPECTAGGGAIMGTSGSPRDAWCHVVVRRDGVWCCCCWQ